MSAHALRVAKRAAHRPEKGSCTRCGLLVRTSDGWCPPGFWMTPKEANAWAEMSPGERETFERKRALDARYTMRLVRFDDVYLVTLGDDHEPRPEWGTRDEACEFPSSAEAHEAKRQAKAYEGKRANVVVVRVKTASKTRSTPPTSDGDRS